MNQVKNDIKSSVILKTISYLIVPVLLFLIIINSLSIIMGIDSQEEIQTKNYFETQRFADRCLNSLYNTVASLENRRTQYVLTEETDVIVAGIVADQTTDKINYNLSNSYYYYQFYTLVIGKDGTVYTNVPKTAQTDTVQEIKDYILSKPKHFKYDQEGTATDIKKMQYENILYESRFEYIRDAGYQVYTALMDEQDTELAMDKLAIEIVADTYESAPIVVSICVPLLLLVSVYLIISVGHKKGYEGIYTNSLDKIPLEIAGMITIIVLSLEGVILMLLIEGINRTASITIPLGIMMCLVMYETLAIATVTIIRRIKAGVFFKNSISYRVVQYIKKKMTNLTHDVFYNFSRTAKLIFLYTMFIVISVILYLLGMDNFLFWLLELVFWYWVFRKILRVVNSAYQLRDRVHDIYNGNIEEKLKEEEFSGDLKEIAHELNDISGGLSNAMEQGLKSERLKTELITNVSHDIKTPLTSIINYVDLLKKENIEDEKIQEYLTILENKSQRLKKLTEDLVEASKASSGNIKLTMEKLNVKELIKQVSGEFEDKLEEKGLEIIETIPEEEIYIEADSKYMYRVMENMYTNIMKYTLENSRVYVDVTKKENTVEIALKNISKDKLNISVDELMQRFVRGDSARTTEGSGLGISIAKSLTELQNGKFELYLDGDLFKVVITFQSK